MRAPRLASARVPTSALTALPAVSACLGLCFAPHGSRPDARVVSLRKPFVIYEQPCHSPTTIHDRRRVSVLAGRSAATWAAWLVAAIVGAGACGRSTDTPRSVDASNALPSMTPGATRGFAPDSSIEPAGAVEAPTPPAADSAPLDTLAHVRWVADSVSHVLWPDMAVNSTCLTPRYAAWVTAYAAKLVKLDKRAKAAAAAYGPTPTTPLAVAWRLGKVLRAYRGGGREFGLLITNSGLTRQGQEISEYMHDCDDAILQQWEGRTDAFRVYRELTRDV